MVSGADYRTEEANLSMNRQKCDIVNVLFSRFLEEPLGPCTKSMGFPVNYCFTTLINISLILVHWSKSKLVYGMLMILNLHSNAKKVFRKALKLLFLWHFDRYWWWTAKCPNDVLHPKISCFVPKFQDIIKNDKIFGFTK